MGHGPGREDTAWVGDINQVGDRDETDEGEGTQTMLGHKVWDVDQVGDKSQ